MFKTHHCRYCAFNTTSRKEIRAHVREEHDKKGHYDSQGRKRLPLSAHYLSLPYEEERDRKIKEAKGLDELLEE